MKMQCEHKRLKAIRAAMCAKHGNGDALRCKNPWVPVSAERIFSPKPGKMSSFPFHVDSF